jgi:hypothetical protein
MQNSAHARSQIAISVSSSWMAAVCKRFSSWIARLPGLNFSNAIKHFSQQTSKTVCFNIAISPI